MTIYKNTDEAFAAGLKSGRNWPDAWEPRAFAGGPWMLDKNSTCEISAAWRNGWRKGHSDKLASLPPECSICRGRHGLEIIHACE